MMRGVSLSSFCVLLVCLCRHRQALCRFPPPPGTGVGWRYNQVPARLVRCCTCFCPLPSAAVFPLYTLCPDPAVGMLLSLSLCLPLSRVFRVLPLPAPPLRVYNAFKFCRRWQVGISISRCVWVSCCSACFFLFFAIFSGDVDSFPLWRALAWKL